MASAVNKLHTYTGLEASPLSGAHQLYFAPLEDLHKVFRTDGSTNVVVVTFIGRTNHSKSLLANLMVDHTVFLITDEIWSTEDTIMSSIEAYYDRQHATIYLNLISLFEGPFFLNMCENMAKIIESHKSDSNLDVDSYIQSQESIELKLLLHAFLLSNHVFLVQDSPQLDLEWVELLKNLSAVKAILSGHVTRASPVNPTLRRLLEGPAPSLSVVCDLTSTILSTHLDIIQTENLMNEIQKQIEAQIRHLAKRSQFDNLLQISSSQMAHSVILGDSPTEVVERIVTASTNGLIPDSLRGIQTLRKWLVAKIRQLQGTAHIIQAFVPPQQAQEGDGRKKKAKQNSRLLVDGYSLATAHEWFELSHTVLHWLSQDDEVSRVFTDASQDADYAFSEECCRHALAAARGTYFSGLPNSYGSSYHQKRMNISLRVFASLSRGSAAKKAQIRFVEECTAYWSSGHRKCDAVSMTNRPCMHNYHLTKDTQDSVVPKLTAELAASAPSYTPSSRSPTSSTKVESEIPVMAHSNDFKALHRCNCGKNQSIRTDPFDLVQANTTFFSNPECCRYLPSLLESQLAKMRAQTETRPKFEDVELLAMPHSLRLVNLGWEATVMGATSEFFKAEGSTKRLESQKGFVDGYDSLLPWRVDPSGSMGLSAYNDDAPSFVSTSELVSRSPQGLMAHIGFEYECNSGHRWFATPQVLTALGLGQFEDDQVDVQSLLETSYIPIFTTCTCVKKTAQLQRIYIATPRDSSVRITFNLFVQVYARLRRSIGAEEGKAKSVHLEPGIDDHLVLPQDRLVCLRLPYIYSYQDKPLLQGKLASNDDCRFFLEPRSFGLITT